MTMQRRWQLGLALWGLAFSLPLPAQENANKNQQETNAPSQRPPAASQTPATNDPNYVIGPQDVLDVSVWKEPGVSRVVPVRPDGKISLPLLNDVQAAGLSPSQLSAELTERLKKYIETPQVTVIVTQINSQRVYIAGQVARPGAYPLLPGMTFLQALSTAGGFGQFANQKKILLLRNVDGKQTKTYINYKEIINGSKPEENVVLKAGDQIVVQ